MIHCPFHKKKPRHCCRGPIKRTTTTRETQERESNPDFKPDLLNCEQPV